jgi:hypothetical protein
MTVGDGLLFTELRSWLLQNSSATGQTHFSTLTAACEFLTTTPKLPDLAVVFREWCDEHPQQIVQTFIGRMLFQRIVCCEGPLCISEARTHQFWPSACRTSLPAATLIISQHLRQLAAGQPPLSPLAAPEDVFTAEVNSAAAGPAKYARQIRAFVLVGDAVLRQTVVAILTSMSVQAAADMPEVLEVLVQNPAGRPDWLVVDADAPQIPTELLLQLKRSGSSVLALTGFPAQPLPDWASCPLHKSEIVLQLAAFQSRTE